VNSIFGLVLVDLDDSAVNPPIVLIRGKVKLEWLGPAAFQLTMSDSLIGRIGFRVPAANMVHTIGREECKKFFEVMVDARSLSLYKDRAGCQNLLPMHRLP
jgi:hypothetical protein